MAMVTLMQFHCMDTKNIVDIPGSDSNQSRHYTDLTSDPINEGHLIRLSRVGERVDAEAAVRTQLVGSPHRRAGE